MDQASSWRQSHLSYRQISSMLTKDLSVCSFFDFGSPIASSSPYTVSTFINKYAVTNNSVHHEKVLYSAWLWMTSGLFQSASTGLTSLSCIGIQPRAFPTVLFCTWLSLKSYSKLLVNLMQSKYAVLIHYLTEALLHSFTQLHIIAATTLFHMHTSLLDACCDINVSSHVILCTKCIFSPIAHLGHDFQAVIQPYVPF